MKSYENSRNSKRKATKTAETVNEKLRKQPKQSTKSYENGRNSKRKATKTAETVNEKLRNQPNVMQLLVD